ncbi:glycosyltransferase [Paenibacillus sp. LMG 31457]|uniref:Glycosyltransferase n=1 Tax=Paenibacillus planticolens TaxID=2654976 RepID=A0ABX1ZZ60_9BACL|nr:glycosyltransferase [Paenibacillus planticolens]
MFIDGVIPYLSANHEVTVFCIKDNALRDREVVKGVTYIRVEKNNYLMNVARELKKLTAGNRTFDVIHVFNRPLNVPVIKEAMPGSRIVLSCHNEMFRKEKLPDDKGRRVVEIAHNIMSISNYIGSTIVNRFPEAASKVKTVYSGINLDRYKPIWREDAQAERTALRKKYGVENKKVVLFVGRLSANKGADVLLRAMQRVIQKHEDAVLVIVGSKWFSDNRVTGYISSLRKLGNSLGTDRVVFTNFVPPSKIPSIYLLGDVFVCSSQWQEPLARVHYEAMGAGLPIITTNRGGNAEIISNHKNGIVISAYTDPWAFANSISHIFTHPSKANELGRAGRKFVEGNYGFQHVAKRLLELYV